MALEALDALEALLVGVVLLSATGTARAHEGGLGNQLMWSVCDVRKVDDHCSFESADHDVFRGSCQSMSNALVCVRNQPIERAVGSPHIDVSEQGRGATRSLGRGWAWMAGSSALLVGGLAYFTLRRRPAA